MSYFKSRNLLLVLALAFALALLVVIIVRYKPEDQLQSVVKALPEGVDVSLEDIDYTHIEGGVARWRLVASQVARQADSKVMKVKNPSLDFYDDQGKKNGELKALSGDVTDDYQKVFLHGNVVLKNSDGNTLYADELDYDQKMQIATTDTPVRLVADGMTMNGTGMVYKVAEKRLILKSKVNGVIEER